MSEQICGSRRRIKSKVVPPPPYRRQRGEGNCVSCLYLTSALDGGEWSASRPGRSFSLEWTPGTH
jgi:hypothetical protein